MSSSDENHPHKITANQEPVIERTLLNKNEIGVLTDDNGNRSMMRLMSFMALFAAITSSLISLTDSHPNSTEGVYITTAFLLAAFAPKALQPFIENSYPPRSSRLNAASNKDTVYLTNETQCQVFCFDLSNLALNIT